MTPKQSGVSGKAMGLVDGDVGTIAIEECYWMSRENRVENSPGTTHGIGWREVSIGQAPDHQALLADASSGMESEVALIIRWLCVYSVWSSNKVTTKVF